jgi:hypothetical protein
MLIENALILARAGVDILLLDDDVAMPNRLMIGPDTWREYFKPRLSKVINLVREESPQLLVFFIATATSPGSFPIWWISASMLSTLCSPIVYMDARRHKTGIR